MKNFYLIGMDFESLSTSDLGIEIVKTPLLK